MRIALEALCWVAALMIVCSLASCEAGTAQEECVITSQGEVCRTPDGISTP